MSKEGIERFAAVLSQMQVTRIQLLGMTTDNGSPDKQDLKLAQLLERAQDEVKDDFTRITTGKES